MGGRLWVPVVSGPLAPYAAGYGSWLAGRGYSLWTVSHRLWQLDLLSRWLEREGLGPDELTPERVERFLDARRAAGYSTWISARSTALPLGYLRELGVVPGLAPVVAEGPLELLLAEYRGYLFDQRGLCEHSVLDVYEPAARLFLLGRETVAGLDLERLTAADVSLFLAAECPKRGIDSARCMVSGGPVPAALSAFDRADRGAVAVGGARGRRSAGPIAAAWAGACGGRPALVELRSAADGRPARLRDLVAAVAAGVARPRSDRAWVG